MKDTATDQVVVSSVRSFDKALYDVLGDGDTDRFTWSDLINDQEEPIVLPTTIYTVGDDNDLDDVEMTISVRMFRTDTGQSYCLLYEKYGEDGISIDETEDLQSDGIRLDSPNDHDDNVVFSKNFLEYAVL